MLSKPIEQVATGESLKRDQMADVVDRIMKGTCDPVQIGALLTALHKKGETVEELTGAATAMRAHMKEICCDHPHAVDTCGTGGSGKGTFNISTAAAFVAAVAAPLAATAAATVAAAYCWL